MTELMGEEHNCGECNHQNSCGIGEVIRDYSKYQHDTDRLQEETVEYQMKVAQKLIEGILILGAVMTASKAAGADEVTHNIIKELKSLIISTLIVGYIKGRNVPVPITDWLGGKEIEL